MREWNFSILRRHRESIDVSKCVLLKREARGIQIAGSKKVSFECWQPPCLCARNLPLALVDVQAHNFQRAVAINRELDRLIRSENRSVIGNLGRGRPPSRDGGQDDQVFSECCQRSTHRAVSFDRGLVNRARSPRPSLPGRTVAYFAFGG